MMARVKNLWEVRTRWTDNQRQVYENLDKEITEDLLQVESKCRQLQTGGIPWTPAMADLYLQLRFWHLEIRIKLKL